MAGSEGYRGQRTGLARGHRGEERLPSTLVRWAPGVARGADVPPLAGGAGCHFTGHPRRQRKGQDAGQRGTAGSEGRRSRPEVTAGPSPPGRGDRGQRWALDTGQAVSGGRRREAAAGVPGRAPPARRGHAPPTPPAPGTPLTRRRCWCRRRRPRTRCCGGPRPARSLGPRPRRPAAPPARPCPPAPGTPAAAPRRPGARPSA